MSLGLLTLFLMGAVCAAAGFIALIVVMGGGK